MVRIFTALSILLISLMLSVPAYSARNISLPFTENFDSSSYTVDLLFLTNGATHTYLESGGWSGGAAKFTPPTSAGGYSGLGGFMELSGKVIHVRVLVKIGSTYLSTVHADGYGRQNKWTIVVRDNEGDRGMAMLEYAAPDDGDYPGMPDYYTFGCCEDNSCTYEGDPEQSFPYGLDSFKSTDYEGEWICIEYQYNLTAETSTAYIWTQDGVFNGEYHSYNYENGGAGDWDYIQIIGGYFNGYHSNQDSNTYIMFDELKIDTQYIGPPSGFGNNDSTIIGVSIIGGVVQ